jgi:hypothetical protein
MEGEEKNLEPILFEDLFEDEVGKKKQEEEDADDDREVIEEGVGPTFVAQGAGDAAPARP